MECEYFTQAVQLQHLLSTSKTGLTSFKGRTDSNFCHSSVCFYPSPLLLLMLFVCFAIRPMYYRKSNQFNWETCNHLTLLSKTKTKAITG